MVSVSSAIVRLLDESVPSWPLSRSDAGSDAWLLAVLCDYLKIESKEQYEDCSIRCGTT